MRYKNPTYNLTNLLAAFLMVLTLLWLTVSTPFVNAAYQQQDLYTQSDNSPAEDIPESEESPFNSATEEKTETNSNTLSEYLHYIHELSHMTGTSHKHDYSHSFDVYVAFHGELLCPPPNSFLS